jgi:hypothetical protein
MLTPRRLSSHTALPTLTRRQDDSRAVKCAPAGASTAPRLPVTVVGHPYTNDKLMPAYRCDLGSVYGTRRGDPLRSSGGAPTPALDPR